MCARMCVFNFFMFTLHFFRRRKNFCHRRRGSPRKLWSYWLVIWMFSFVSVMYLNNSRVSFKPVMSSSNSTFVVRGKFSFKRCRNFAEIVIASHITYLQMKKTLKRQKVLLWKQKNTCQASRCSQLNLKRFDSFFVLYGRTDVLWTVWLICINLDNLAETTVNIRVSHERRSCHLNICS